MNCAGRHRRNLPNQKAKPLDFDVLPLLVLPLLALVFRIHLAAWMFMWALAYALYSGSNG